MFFKKLYFIFFGNFLKIWEIWEYSIKIWEEIWEIWELWGIWKSWAPCNFFHKKLFNVSFKTFFEALKLGKEIS